MLVALQGELSFENVLSFIAISNLFGISPISLAIINLVNPTTKGLSFPSINVCESSLYITNGISLLKHYAPSETPPSSGTRPLRFKTVASQPLQT